MLFRAGCYCGSPWNQLEKVWCLAEASLDRFQIDHRKSYNNQVRFFGFGTNITTLGCGSFQLLSTPRKLFRRNPSICTWKGPSLLMESHLGLWDVLLRERMWLSSNDRGVWKDWKGQEGFCFSPISIWNSAGPRRFKFEGYRKERLLENSLEKRKLPWAWKIFARVKSYQSDLSGFVVTERKLSGLVVTATARKLSSKEKTTFKEIEVLSNMS